MTPIATPRWCQNWCQMRFDIFHFASKSSISKEKPHQTVWFFGCGGRTRFCLCDGQFQKMVLRISPFAVPEKIIGLTLFLDFFDRGTQSACTAPATGSVQAL